MNPNSALTAWQLALMIVVPVLSMAAWLTAIFLAARQHSDHAHEASAAPGITTRVDYERQDKLAALGRRHGVRQRHAGRQRRAVQAALRAIQASVRDGYPR